jgi:hypothetical protein
MTITMTDFGKCEFYANFTVHLNIGVHEVIEERVIFKQCIPKKHKCFDIRTYKLYNMTDYTYNMNVYLGKDSKMQHM